MLHANFRGRQVRAVLAARVLGLALLVSLCPGAHAESAADPAQAELLARGGQHAEAAKQYERLARRGFFSWDTRLAVLAAREYAAAGQYDDAERMLGKAEGRTRGDDAVLAARVEAEIALARHDPRRALAALHAIPTPLPAPYAPDLLALRGRAEFAAGNALAGVRAFEERGRVLGTAEARAANERLLADELRHYTATVSVPPDATDRERGWLELVPLLASSASADPGTAARRAADWRDRHPEHPGAAFLPAPAGARAAASGAALPAGQPAQLALLLPLSGRASAAGSAVRDGFIGAWFAAPADGRPRVRIYDTAGGAASVYKRALADGAQLVVGPLTREDVAAVAALPSLPVPTLALNSLAAGTAPAFLYQFALDPEQEARAVARRIAADGLVRGIAFFPRSPWGQRIAAALTAELQATGTVTLTSTQYYEPGAQDFSGPLSAALGRFGGAGNRSDSKSKPPPRRDPVAEAQAGPQFAFVAATPQAARALKPQLRFQMTYEIPIYSTSDAWDPSVHAAADMDGLVFPEMPWILYSGQGAPELWDVLQTIWGTESRGRLRLYAFGCDAFRIAMELRGNARVIGLEGLTGGLEIGSDGRVQRRLQFARIEGGRLQPLGAGVPTLPAPAAGDGAR